MDREPDARRNLEAFAPKPKQEVMSGMDHSSSVYDALGLPEPHMLVPDNVTSPDFSVKKDTDPLAESKRKARESAARRVANGGVAVPPHWNDK